MLVQGAQVDPMPYFEAEKDGVIAITITGWGAGFDLNGIEIFDTDMDRIGVNNDKEGVVTKKDEHTAVFEKTDDITSIKFLNYTAWTYAESFEIIYTDGKTEFIEAPVGYKNSIDIELENVKEIHVTVGVNYQNNAAAPMLKMGPSLKATAPTSGSTTVSMMDDNHHSGRSIDNTTQNHLFCMDMDANLHGDGATFYYGNLDDFLSSEGQSNLKGAFYFALYNYWTNKYPGSGTPTYIMDKCSNEPGGWAYERMMTGVIWYIRGFTALNGYDGDTREAVIDMANAAIAYASAHPNGTFPEDSVADSVGILNPEPGTGRQNLISVGAPKFAHIQVHKTNTSVSTAFINEHPVTGARYGIFSNKQTAQSAQAKQTPTNTDIGTDGTSGFYVTVGADGYSDICTLSPGTYWVLEITRPTDIVWQWDPELHEVTVTLDDTESSPCVVTSIEESVGDLKLTKTSSNNTLTNGNPCYNMSGIKYNVYTTNTGDARDPVLSGQVGTLTITSYDVATSTGTSDVLEDLPAGTYWVQEVETSVAGTGYQYNKTAKSVVVEAGKVNEVSFADLPTHDPEVLSIYKISDKGNKRIRETSATFKVEYFTNYTWDGTAERTWYFKTINGIVRLNDSSYFDTSDPSYINSDLFPSSSSGNTYPLGSVRVTEIKAPEGFNKLNLILEGKITLNNNNQAVFEWVTAPTNGQLLYESDGTPSIINPQIFGGVKFAKIDAETGLAVPQGAGTFNGVQIAIYNNSGAAIDMPDGTSVANGAIALTITGNSSGIATTAAKALPVGDYYAVEVAAPTGYKLNTGWRVDFSITDADDGVIIDKTEQASKLPDTPIRGGVQIEKWDKDLEQKVAQGDADFAGIQFEITSPRTLQAMP